MSVVIVSAVQDHPDKKTKQREGRKKETNHTNCSLLDISFQAGLLWGPLLTNHLNFATSLPLQLAEMTAVFQHSCADQCHGR